MRRCRRLLLALGLTVLVLLTFEGVRGCGFVGYDDDAFVANNPYVRQGLTWPSIRWALTAELTSASPYADYWTPLTFLSRLLDGQIWGLDPAGHHATNVLLHAANSILLFLVLEALTGAFWRSAFVAATLAVHPLHVESVAWLAERKDVLSGLFFLLVLAAYGRYVRRPSRGRYGLVLGLFVLALLSKPMMVTLPLVLLLVDYWPLGRFGPGRPSARVVGRLLLEKVPLLCLAVAAGYVTLVATWRGGFLAPWEVLPLPGRIANAAWSVVVYMAQALWPHPLAVVYPFTAGGPGSSRVALAVLILVALSALAVRHARGRPYLLVGWLWFLLMLAPVSGLLQSGPSAHADRYTYLPLIGFFLALAWSFGDRSRLPGSLLAAGATLLLIAWVALSRAQVACWQDAITLFEHAIRVTGSDNPLAQNNLAVALAAKGRSAEAEAHFRESLRSSPGYAEARANLATLLLGEGRTAEARLEFQRLLGAHPRAARALLGLGQIAAREGRGAEAAAYYAEAVRLAPDSAAAHYDWGNLLAASGQWAAAGERYAEAVRLRPDDVEARNNLGLALALQGRLPEAIRELSRALELAPDHALARTNLARALAALGRHDEAIAECRRALASHPDDPDAHFHLGVSLAASGRTSEARRHFEAALRVLPGYPGAAEALRALGSPQPQRDESIASPRP